MMSGEQIPISNSNYRKTKSTADLNFKQIKRRILFFKKEKTESLHMDFFFEFKYITKCRSSD